MARDPLIGLCGANLAAWCTAVCRTHGLVTEAAADVWWSPTRTPPGVPDLVTLGPGGAPELLLAVADSSAGCVVVDTFADLDLEPAGFAVQHERTWVSRSGSGTPGDRSLRWRRVTAGTAFAAWRDLWRESATGATVDVDVDVDATVDMVRPALLGDSAVSVLGGEADGRVRAGTMVVEAAGVLGITDVFAVGPSAVSPPVDPWPSLVTHLLRTYGERPLVAQVGGVDLTRALDVGFMPLGRVRVWTRADA